MLGCLGSLFHHYTMLGVIGLAQIVLKLPATTIKNMQNFYKSDLQPKLPPGAIFSAKTAGCSITAYKSGKVLFQGANYEIEANRWEKESNEISPKKPKSTSTTAPDFSTKTLIGTDEVGTGDYFGPITVVAAFVQKEQIAELTKLGVRDSKGMKDKEICEVAKQLIKQIPYSLLVLSNEKYNSLQAQGMNQGQMKAILHNQAILHLKKKLEGQSYDGILIDQFVVPSTYFQYIKNQPTQVNEKNMYFYTKAESLHHSVAAASIIARYAFVKEMDKLSEQAGFEIPKGAGNHVDVAAAKLIKEQGVQALQSYTKLHFANTEKAKKLV